MLQRFEGFRLTEEPGHVDQDVLEQGTEFARVCLQIFQVVFHLLRLEDQHSSQDSSLYGRVFVVCKIDLGRLSQQTEDLFEVALRQQILRPFSLKVGHVGMPAQLDQLLRDVLWPED